MTGRVREPARSTPILEEKDVVVSGGGMAGVAAAVAAARCGAEVLLIERYGFLGGMATAAFVDTIPPVAKGIGTEFESRIEELGAISRERGFWSSWDPEAIKRACFEITEEAGVELLLHSYMAGAVVEGKALTGVLVESKSGRAAIMGKAFVDATGDGDVSAMAGARFLYGDEKGRTLPMTLMFNLRNVDKRRAKKYLNPGIKKFLEEAIADGTDWKIGFRQYDGQPGVNAAPMIEEDEVSVWGGVLEGVDALDARDLSKAERLARCHVPILVDVLREHVPGFENAVLKDTAAQVGVRESRRICGMRRMTLDEARAGGRAEEGVGKLEYGSWKYWVPYGVLVPEKTDGVLTAGRCVSADREVLYMAGLREVPGAMLTGQAAGTAAALCSRLKVRPRDLEIAAVRELLVRQGALSSDALQDRPRRRPGSQPRPR